MNKNVGWSNPTHDFQTETARESALDTEKRAAFALAASFMEGEDRLELLDKAGLTKNKKS